MPTTRRSWLFTLALSITWGACTPAPQETPAPGGTGGRGAGGTPGTGGSTATGGAPAATGGMPVTGTGGGTPGTGGNAGTGGMAPPADAGPPEAPTAETAPAANDGLLAVGTRCPTGQSYGDPLGPTPTATLVKGGYGVLEGPVWHAAQKALFFTEFDQLDGRIYKYMPADEKFVLFADDVGVNGLALDPQGNLIAASQDMRRLTRFDVMTAQRTPVANSDMYMGKPFNAVNDVLVRGDGNMYFTDPTFINLGRPGQGTTAYYRLSTAGEVTRLGTGPNPNSLGISPDGQWLYITSSGDEKLWRHPLNPDGTVGTRTDFIAARSESLAIDCAGNLYLSAAGKLSAYTAQGMLIRSWGNIPAGITNLAIGGEDAKTLYITARGGLYKTALTVPGLPN